MSEPWERDDKGHERRYASNENIEAQVLRLSHDQAEQKNLWP